MAAVWMLLRSGSRRSARGWLPVVLLLAVVGGGVLAAGAGARRTDTAYPRFLAAGDAADIIVSGLYTSGAPKHGDQLLGQIERLPQVAQAGRAYYVLVALVTPSGRRLGFSDVSTIALGDGRYGSSIDRFKLLDGRLADPRRADEVTISFPFADSAGLHVGDVLRLRAVRRADVAAALAGGATNPELFDIAHGTERTVRVAGIMASPVANDFPPLPPLNGGAGTAYFTPAFLRQGGADLSAYLNLVVKLRGGQADLQAFETAAERIAGGQQVQFITQKDHEAVVQSALHLQALTLGALAGLAGAVLLLVLGQGVARRIALDASDNTALRALGTTRFQLWAVAMSRAVLAAVAGAVGALVVAVALSPLTPIGLARIAEPAPGVSLDAPVVVGGAAALILVVLLLAALPAWQASRRALDSPPAGRGSRLGAAMGGVGLPSTAVAGVRLALEPGRGRTAVPVRSAITAATVAAATVSAALCFTASLGHLLDTPHLYGWNWDAQVSGLLNPQGAAATIAATPSIAAAVQGVTGDIGVGSDHVAGLAMDPVKGRVEPVLVSGRAPQTGGEIVLGTQTQPAVGLGDQVTVRVGDRSQQMRVVGRGVLPILSDTSRLGVGAWLSYGGLRRLLGTATPPPDTFLVRYGSDSAAAYRALVHDFGSSGVALPQRPTGLVSFGDVSAMPLVLGGVLALCAVATMAHAVVTSVRRRRRDLAILKTLGFVRGQVALTVAWQTTTIAALAAVIGVPLGAAAGRWAWTLFADQQGMVAEPVVPWWSLLLLLPGALLVANLVAAIPGRFAARTSPALVLRAE